MLGIKHQSAGWTGIEPGGDPGVLLCSSELSFQGRTRQEIYGWVDETLRRQRYDQLGRAERGVIRQYIVKLTGLSRAQATRLITQYVSNHQKA